LLPLPSWPSADPSLAQEQGRTAPPSNGYNVFIIGDALAGGLWAGTTRVGYRYPDFAITGRFKEGSGLARPDIYDWASAVPKILERHQVDLAIVLIGTNDGQDIRSDNGRLTFGSSQWATAYQAKVDEIVRAFTEHGVTVYWVGLPPMRSANHEEAVTTIADLQRERVLANGAKYIDVRPQFANPTAAMPKTASASTAARPVCGRWTASSSSRPATTSCRLMVFDAISADLGLGSPGAVVAEGGDGFAGEALANLPVFGSELADGSTRIFSASDLPVQLAGEDQVQGARLDFDQAADTPAAPGSAAAALFDSGSWPTPKPGRIDDFSWPQAQ
jgi:uncharacterized protein